MVSPITANRYNIKLQNNQITIHNQKYFCKYFNLFLTMITFKIVEIAKQPVNWCFSKTVKLYN